MIKETKTSRREKLEKMDRALRLLEDLKNSQVAMLEKSSNLQLDAMEFNFSEMEKNMGDLFSTFNESLDIITILDKKMYPSNFILG